MSVIGDAALSAFFGKLFEKLTSDDLLKFFQQEKFDADLKRWRTTLMKIHAVLDDAEEKQMTNRLVKIWLDELEDLAYDVDDILDEFATEALGRKLNPEPSTSKVRKIVDACIGSNRSFATSMRSKLLEKFSVNGCEQLDVSIPNFPKLHAFEIKGCKGVVSRSTDELCFPKSTILSIPYVKSLTEEFMHGLAKVENLEIDNCKELTSLWQDEFKSLITLDIRDCSSLVNISLTSTLRILNIEGCSGLKSLSISNCTCLEKASIMRCNSLTLISRGQLPQNLKTLNIRDCENLQFLVDEGEASSNSSSLLEDLVIRGCPSLKCLSSSGDLPTTLKCLQIYSCMELTSLSSKNRLPTALKYLVVFMCPKMELIANNLPSNASLEYLRIVTCAKLKSLPVGLHKLCHLNYIEITRCPSFVSFLDGGLLPTSLRELSIYGCEKLESWPNCMPNLNSLRIVNCPSIIYFPEEGYPTSLTSLLFGGENICKQVTMWGLHKLTSLTSLRIDGGIPDWQSFPDEQDGKLTMMLPSSLTRLTIQSITNIVILSSKGFQNLSSLEVLFIENCPKLASLPEKGLPPSLLRLYILECPLLKRHCKKGGREWSKIANVPCVEIDGRPVYALEEEQQ